MSTDVRTRLQAPRIYAGPFDVAWACCVERGSMPVAICLIEEGAGVERADGTNSGGEREGDESSCDDRFHDNLLLNNFYDLTVLTKHLHTPAVNSAQRLRC